MGEDPDSVTGGTGSKTPLSLGSVALIILATRRLQRKSDRDDPDAPGIVSTDEQTERLNAAARRLAKDGREDRAAVQELQGLAGGRKRTWKRAVRSAQLGGAHFDRADDNRAYRLLIAARDDLPVTPASAAEQARFSELDRVLSKTRGEDQIFDSLVDREPQLSRLFIEARDGRYGPRYIPERPSAAQVRDLAWRENAAAQARGALELAQSVKELAGPTSASTDMVITARRTRDWIDFYLQQQRPAPSSVA